MDLGSTMNAAIYERGAAEGKEIRAAELAAAWPADGLIPHTGFGILRGPSYTGKSLVADTELARQKKENDEAIEIVRRRHGEEMAAEFAETLPPYTDQRLFVMTEPFPVPVTRGSHGRAGAGTTHQAGGKRDGRAGEHHHQPRQCSTLEH